MKERVDTFQVGPVDTKVEVKQLIKDKMPDVIKEARKSANGKTITGWYDLRYEEVDGTDTNFIAHIFIEHLDKPVSGVNLVRIRKQIKERGEIGTWSSPIQNEI